MSKPKAIGCTDLTHLEAVGNPLFDGLRLGPPKPIFIKASIGGRGVGGKPAHSRDFWVHNPTHSSHVSSLMWRVISRGGASSSSKRVAGGSSAQTVELSKAPSRSSEAPMAISEGILKGNKFSPFRSTVILSTRCSFTTTVVLLPRRLRS